jgi:prepilin-type processing-associated H-X9-DG protein
LALHLYATEHEDLLPPEGFANPLEQHTNTGWYVQLPQILGLPRYHDMPWRKDPTADVGRCIWICPSNPRRSNGNNLFHYCLNGYIDGSGANDRSVKLGSVPTPAIIVYLFDSKNLPAVASGTSRPWNFVHTNLHSGGAQFLFLDAHVRRFKNIDYWDFVSNTGRTNNPNLIWIP